MSNIVQFKLPEGQNKQHEMLEAFKHREFREIMVLILDKDGQISYGYAGSPDTAYFMLAAAQADIMDKS